MHLYTYFPTLISNPVRLAAFRLIEAGLEQNPGIESMLLISIPTPPILLIMRDWFVSALLHVLQLASKTGSALSGKS